MVNNQKSPERAAQYLHEGVPLIAALSSLRFCHGFGIFQAIPSTAIAHRRKRGEQDEGDEEEHHPFRGGASGIG
jgi:hypothetical protein